MRDLFMTSWESSYRSAVIYQVAGVYYYTDYVYQLLLLLLQLSISVEYIIGFSPSYLKHLFWTGQPVGKHATYSIRNNM